MRVSKLEFQRIHSFTLLILKINEEAAKKRKWSYLSFRLLALKKRGTTKFLQLLIWIYYNYVLLDLAGSYFYNLMSM